MTYHRFSVLVAAVTALVFSVPSIAQAAIHAGDKLYVLVYNHPELSEEITVDSAGRISLPLVGSVVVATLEPRQIASRIRQKLAPYVLEPAVNVQRMAESSSVFVSGGPGGVLTYQPGETLVSALSPVNQSAVSQSATVAQVDGVDLQHSRVDLRRVSILRDGRRLGNFDVPSLSAKGLAGPVLHPGDTIVLINKPIAVRVEGDVKQPGIAYLNDGDSYAQAVTQVGGLTLTAATAQIVLERDGQTRTVTSGDPEFQAAPRNGDVIRIPTAPRVTVAGSVNTPGPVVLRSDFSLISALYSAGGPTKRGDIGQVQIFSKGLRSTFDVTKLAKGDMSQNPILRDADLVLVPEGRQHIDYTAVFQSLSSLRFVLKPF